MNTEGKMKDYKPTVVFDFDGVIHSYKSGWQGPGVIPDPVVPGIVEAIDHLRANGYRVVVVSTRCSSIGGKTAVEDYLTENRIAVDAVMAEKPPALCYVDDRAICFQGNAGKLVDQIKGFENWVKDPRVQLLDCKEIHMDLKPISDEEREELIKKLANQPIKLAAYNPHPAERLRPCLGTYWNKEGQHRVKGRFHCWSYDCEEFCAAVIECDDGTIAMCQADTVVFLDRNPENGERR